MKLQDRKFDPHLSEDIGNGMALHVTGAEPDQAGDARASIELWNGTLRAKDKLSLSSDLARKRFAKRALEEEPSCDPAALIKALLKLSSQVPALLAEQPKGTSVRLQVSEPISGVELLCAVEGFLRQYVAMPSPAAYDAVVLWIAQAHAIEAFDATPRLGLLSPERECGKSRALEVIDLLVPSPMQSVSASPAAMFRAISDLGHRPTFLFDEIDTVFGPKAKEHEDLRALINAGHRRGAVVHRCVGDGSDQHVQEFPVFAAVALAGIGNLPDTILSRTIHIPMRRRAPGEHVDPFRSRKAIPAGHHLRDQLELWASTSIGQLSESEPEMPTGVTDRQADVWEPLLAIADHVGSDWPSRARRACAEFVAAKQDDEPTLGTKLLADTRQVFGGADNMDTKSMLQALVDLEEAPWHDMHGRPLDDRRMARILRGYGIRSQKLRLGAHTQQGYRRESFEDAWNRYLPPIPGTTGTTGTTGTSSDSERGMCSGYVDPQAEHGTVVTRTDAEIAADEEIFQ